MKLTARDEIQAFGKTKEVAEPTKKKKPRVTKVMAAEAGIKYSTLRARVQIQDMPLEEALTKPVMTKEEMGSRMAKTMKERRK